MAVFNTDFSYIKRAIDSVLNQDFQDFELLIIDDGSTQNNREALMQYVEQHEDKIIYIRHSNRGQSASINRGVLYSMGDYITILDSDDQYKPNHLTECLKEMENVDLICSTILFGTLFGLKKVFSSIDFRNGFAADADFYEKAGTQFRVKKADLRTYIYHRNMPNSICSTIKKANLVNC
jgi:glycosyltransferase involved in cell wall biosynthesis